MVRSGGRGASSGSRATLLIRALHRARMDDWKSSPVHSFLLQVKQNTSYLQKFMIIMPSYYYLPLSQRQFSHREGFSHRKTLITTLT